MMGIETETPADLDNAIAEVDTFGNLFIYLFFNINYKGSDF